MTVATLLLLLLLLLLLSELSITMSSALCIPIKFRILIVIFMYFCCCVRSVLYILFHCVVLCIVLCKCVLYYCYWVSTQLQLTNIYHIIPIMVLVSFSPLQFFIRHVAVQFVKNSKNNFGVSSSCLKSIQNSVNILGSPGVKICRPMKR